MVTFQKRGPSPYRLDGCQASVAAMFILEGQVQNETTGMSWLKCQRGGFTREMETRLGLLQAVHEQTANMLSSFVQLLCFFSKKTLFANGTISKWQMKYRTYKYSKQFSQNFCFPSTTAIIGPPPNIWEKTDIQKIYNGVKPAIVWFAEYGKKRPEKKSIENGYFALQFFGFLAVQNDLL